MDEFSGPLVDDQVIDQRVLDELAKITDVDGISVLRELVTVFVSTSLARLGAIERALERKDLPEAAREAHALAGSAGSLGARRMADLCRQLRTAANDAEESESRALLGEIDSEFGRARAALLARAQLKK